MSFNIYVLRVYIYIYDRITDMKYPSKGCKHKMDFGKSSGYLIFFKSFVKVSHHKSIIKNKKNLMKNLLP